MKRERLRIGVSSCFFHHDPKRPIFKGKRLAYFEDSMLRFLMHQNALPVLIPPPYSYYSYQNLIEELQLDGLLLQGGSDVCPKSYGQEALRPEWQGDYFRDQYEIELIQNCLKMNKPILGICRGLQVLNVALGGTLYQDIELQAKGAQQHRNWEIYDNLFHTISLNKGSILSKIYPNLHQSSVNSVHHQGIDKLAPGLKINALSEPDQIIEAVSWEQEGYALAVQWHPEFMDFENIAHEEFNKNETQIRNRLALNPLPLLRFFLEEVKNRK